MNEATKMHTQALYHPDDPAIAALQLDCLEKLYDYNQTRPGEQAKRQQLLQAMFAELGAGCYIEPPLHANFGGRHVHFGEGVYANFNLTLVDDTHIYVGAHTMFGPNVTLATAGHPLAPALRAQGYQYNAAITIGENCWLGAAVVVLPGITIGNNVVIGAGSVVTKDLPDDVIAYGNPCKVARKLNQHDREFYFKERRIPADLR